jgi:uncharacterized protein (DUF2336 family)
MRHEHAEQSAGWNQHGSQRRGSRNTGVGERKTATSKSERTQFRNSLNDEDRKQIEESVQQLVDHNPPLSVTSAAPLNARTEPPSVLSKCLMNTIF